MKILIHTISIFLTSCLNNTSKSPEFSDVGKTLDNLKSTYICESIEFENWEEDDAEDATLTVCLINSKSVPLAKDVDYNYEQLKGIAKKIKKSLKNPEEYTSYYIVFIKREKNFLSETSAHTMGANIPAKNL